VQRAPALALAPGAAAQIDHRVPDDAAAAVAGRAAGALPALYSVHLATLNKSMERFVGFGNFLFLFKRETFWMVVQQSCIFAITAVIFKALIGFIVAHFVHNIPSRASASGAACCWCRG
jgi:ABC-type sugar transport system permease subunit